MVRCRWALLIASVAFVPSQYTACAQACDQIVVSMSASDSLKRLPFVEGLAKSIKMSVIAELAYKPDADSLSPLPEGSTLEEYARMISGNTTVICTVEKKVVHIYDENVLNAKGNALNHKFREFSMPTIADLFVFHFRHRLDTEAFRPKNSGLVSGSTGGGSSNDSQNYRLSPEEMTDVAARSVLVRACQEVPIVFAVEIRVTFGQSSQSVWNESEKSVIFEVIR